MSMYELASFLHVTSTVVLFAVLAIEWISLRGIRRSLTYEQARDWAGLWSLLLLLGLPATLLILASGIYLATTAGMWQQRWVAVALPTYVGVIVAGAIAGPRRNRLAAALKTGTGELPGELRRQLRHPLLIASWRWRAALLFGILFVMNVRPLWALWAVGVLAVFGIAWSLPAWRTIRTAASPQQSL